MRKRSRHLKKFERALRWCISFFRGPQILASALVFLFCGLASPGLAAEGGRIAPERLRCEWRTNPLGVDAAAPHFSWTLKPLGLGYRGARQTAYQILVSSSSESLRQDHGDEWDSGKVASSALSPIEYKGLPLTPATRYFWKVRVWNERGNKSPWSTVAGYTTGLWGERWQARWIAAAPDKGSETPPTANPRSSEATTPLPIFRHEFPASKEIADALVFVSGLGQYELRLNGNNVTDHVLTPGWTNYRKRVAYDTYDVTGLLRPGVNAIGVLLGNGMYNVEETAGRYTKFTGSMGQPKLILQLRIRYRDGTTETIVSDDTWETTPGPITFSSTFGGEDYDARREQAGWDRPGLHAESWRTAVEVSGPGGELVAEQAPPISGLAEYRPVKTTHPKPNVTVYDLGQNFSGWPQISVRGQRGSTLRLIAGELLDSRGLVTQHSANASPESENRFSYTLRGGATESWHPRFSYYGFRYVQVEKPPSVKNGVTTSVSLKGEFLHDQVATVGRFETSNRLFSRIHKLIGMAVQSNLFSVLTDCPHREKLGWLEQTHLAGSSIFLNYDVLPLYQKIAQDLQDSQLPDGMVPSIAPEYVAFLDEHGRTTDFRDSPEWGSASILSVWTAYQFSGDRNLLAAHYDTMRNYAAFLRQKAPGHILAYGLGDWYDIGPGEPGYSKLTSKEVTATAIYYQDLVVLSKIAGILDQPTDARAYAEEAAQVKSAFNEKLFHPATGNYDQGSQTANAMPLALGMVPAGREKAVLENLVDDIRRHQNHVTAGDIGFHYVVRALTDGGRSDVLFDMLSRTDSPSYGYQLARGATSLTEAWDSNPASSQNHFMLGHAEEWFYRGLAGIHIEMDRLAGEQIQIRPMPVGKIRRVSASYRSVLGTVRSSWTHVAGQFTLHVSVPVGSEAVVEVPAANASSVSEGGHHLDAAHGVLEQHAAEGGVVCRVTSGEYVFASRL